MYQAQGAQLWQASTKETTCIFIGDSTPGCLQTYAGTLDPSNVMYFVAHKTSIHAMITTNFARPNRDAY
jgi:hypothetical protein